MLTVAYLANQFPVAVEPYVVEEIRELRRRGVRVISGSVRKSIRAQDLPADFSRGPDNVCLEPLHVMVLLHAAVLMAKRWKLISRLVKRALLQGRENLRARLMALLHTWLGAYYAILLQDLDVDHIHVHHGYFGSWIGMTAARLLGVSFSMTLHGSDLLLHPAYLDEKLRNCRFCITISEYNRRLILQHFAELNPESVILSKLGVDIAAARIESDPFNSTRRKFTLFTAGRLHAVKNHSFLVCACARLRDLGLEFNCLIAGEGPERQRLESLIRGHRLQDCITLLGHVAPKNINSLYRNADLFVLTSLSEGIPLVLMEAMANDLIVLAPAITGIPELISHEKTGYLYQPGSTDEFVEKVLAVHFMTEKCRSAETLQHIRIAARMNVFNDFNRQKNLNQFADSFLQSISPQCWSSPDENPVLQQVQLSL
ncbi:MAG: glycosyltransferase family 4 protein [Candidatus Sulfotelmatobacter sp.]|jgi:glycosyltransferase involved in cell wall biosynthesis